MSVKVTIEIDGQVLDAEIDYDTSHLSVARDVEADGNRRKLLETGTFELTGRFTTPPKWREV